ncbi:hypothetical protein T440DRAFT_380939, partial [Plenodomus tracheiphilus IPT5]
EIRILRIEPGAEDDPIQCSLVHINLEHSPEFEAISYAWGIKLPTCPITCDNQELVIRRNLSEGIIVFRNPEHTRDLWADAICINQVDDLEKSAQVQMMSLIFSTATRVLVWLGMEQS